MQNIKDLAALEKLSLSDEEMAFITDKAAFLEAGFAALDDINTEGSRPLVSVLDAGNVLREDVSAKMLPRAELLANAPEQYEGYFAVPRTL